MGLNQDLPGDEHARRCRSLVLVLAEDGWTLLSSFLPDPKHSSRSWYVWSATTGVTLVSRDRRRGKGCERARCLRVQHAARLRGLDCVSPEPGKPSLS